MLHLLAFFSAVFVFWKKRQNIAFLVFFEKSDTTKPEKTVRSDNSNSVFQNTKTKTGGSLEKWEQPTGSKDEGG